MAARSLIPGSLRLRDGRVIEFPAIMGVLNVTPDSFSDGGQFLEPERALEHALSMEAAGAAIIDVGGESTRPVGARTVPVAEELRRVSPVLELLEGHLRIPFSIDTRKAAVARVALRHGAAIINDVSALGADPEMAGLAANADCAVVLMHMRGGPEDHAKLTKYHDVVAEVGRYLHDRAQFALRAGIKPRRIILDPGLGFAKNAPHNLAILSSLHRICALGYPVLVAASNKRFVRQIAGAGALEAAAGNAAVNAFAITSGASIIRVHDVRASLAALKMAIALGQR